MISLVDGGQLRVTAAHPLATPNGYQPAGEMRSGAILIGCNGTRTIATITVVQKRIAVYDLSVEPNPELFLLTESLYTIS